MKPFDVQLERAKRNIITIKKRLADYTIGTVSEDPIFLIDTIYNFFCECHIIKDFIKNDKTINIDKNLNEYIGENDCLKICADICNHKKHLELTRPWTDEIYKVNLTGKVKEKTTEFSINIISDKENKWDFFSLANDCIDRWRYFINHHVS